MRSHERFLSGSQLFRTVMNHGMSPMKDGVTLCICELVVQIRVQIRVRSQQILFIKVHGLLASRVSK